MHKNFLKRSIILFPTLLLGCVLVMCGVKLHWATGYSDNVDNVVDDCNLAEFTQSFTLMNAVMIKYPEGFTVQQEGLPDYIVALLTNRDKLNFGGETEISTNFNGDKEIFIAYKDASIKLGNETVILDSDTFINREAAGIEGNVVVDEIQIGSNLANRVIRRAAGTNQNVLFYYIFRGSKVLRISLFPYEEQDQDDATRLLEGLVKNLTFID